MKYIIAFFCIAGIAVTFAAPPYAAKSVAEHTAFEEGRQKRAADVPKAAPEAQVAEKAAETPEAVAPNDNAAEKSADNSGAQEKAIMPSYREVLEAVETKYLTPDGRALLKSLVPFA